MGGTILRLGAINTWALPRHTGVSWHVASCFRPTQHRGIMMKIRLGLIALALCVLGMGAASAAKLIEPNLYQSQPNEEAGKALLRQAMIQADDGSWERIAVGRVYYLGGMKAEGQAIFDEVLTDDDASDRFRVARVYMEAGEWTRAKPLFDEAIRMEPKEEKWLAEVGAYYLLNGDRETAEALFDRSFKRDTELWATVAAAGAYLGVKPQE
ncbi:tetratricopeptide repeat protein [Dokdonella sp.]|uniref:tetratricopeptide repeat protein n=1 Tax=Dokdonella sp. TaxID=2291710 RepID=UPI003C6EEBC4